MDVVIPVAREEINHTLPYAIASIGLNASHLRIILAGHTMPYCPPYNSAGVVEFGISFDQPAGQPIQNTDKAMRLACNDERVSDPFIWSNDDIYWRRPVSLEELLRISATARGELVRPSTNPAVGTYPRAEAATRVLLESAHLPTWDYERHTPLIVHKDLMLRALDFGGSKRSVYGNMSRPVPEAMASDVKVFKTSDSIRSAEDQPFFSTGNNYPHEKIPAMLGL